MRREHAQHARAVKPESFAFGLVGYGASRGTLAGLARELLDRWAFVCFRAARQCCALARRISSPARSAGFASHYAPAFASW